MIQKNYSWKLGMYVDYDANQVGAELEEVQKNTGLTAENVVNYAKNPNTILNSMLDWNDESAGAKYRLHQARQIINHIQVEIVKKDKIKAPIRAFVKLDNKKSSEFRSIESVISDVEQYQMLLSNAYRELNITKNKYKTLEEIQELLKDIPEIN